MYNTDLPSRAELPTSKQLLRSTLIAAGVAAGLLVTVILPAEYGIDPTGFGGVTGLAEMGEIKVQLADEAAADAQLDQQNTVPSTSAPDERSSLIDRIYAEFLIGSAVAQETRTDEMSFTLAPGEGTEIKLVMTEGATANYSWSVEGGVVNFDTHGDGGGNSTSYEKGRGVPSDEGILEAAFDGNHGWFWRNRGDANVTVTLRTEGQYSDIKRMM